MAIFGIGIDLIEVNRIKSALNKFPKRFRSRIFTKNEIAFCEKRSNPYLSYAARFAAKEAFAKALGTGLRGKISWQDIEVVDDELSKPSLVITGKALKILGKRKVRLSLSHTEDYATAIVIIEEAPTR
ncbi:MAG: holo-ACP synthase [candidate division WOR-3 bacterium]